MNGRALWKLYGAHQYNRTSVMAKGQLGSNREAKKPKQPKKQFPVLLSSSPVSHRLRPNSVETQKKRNYSAAVVNIG
jgi:hypothetical protein